MTALLAALLVAAPPPDANATAPLYWTCTAVADKPARAAACERRAAVYAPCEAVAVPVSDLREMRRTSERTASALTACRERRVADQVATRQVLAGIIAERDAARASRDACEAAGAECRAELAGTPSGGSLARWLAIGLGAGAAVLGAVACATADTEGGRLAGCAVGGVGAGVAIGVSL